MSCNICFKEFDKKNKELECKRCRKSVCKNCLKAASFLSNEKLKNEVCALCLQDITNAQNRKKNDAQKKADEEARKLEFMIEQKLNQMSKTTDPLFNKDYDSRPASGLPLSPMRNKNTDFVVPPRRSKQIPQVKPSSSRCGTNTEDEVTKRLNKLKAQNDANSNDNSNSASGSSGGDFASRLANLTGKTDAVKQKRTIWQDDDRTEEEKIADIINCVNDEVELDNIHPEAEKYVGVNLEERLAKLKAFSPSPNKKEETSQIGKSIDADINEIEEMESGYLSPPRFNAQDFIPVDFTEQKETEEEFPWCELCNDDATLRCPQCDDELFCKACYKTVHDDREMRRHKPVTYKMPKNSSYRDT